MVRITELARPIQVDDWEDTVVPEGFTAEVLAGELVVSPSGSLDHGRVAARLVRLLAPFCPPGWEPVVEVQWRVAVGGVVAMAPVPDVMVVPTTLTGPSLTEVPLLAIEVGSPPDQRRLANGQTRRQANRADYAANGLLDYLEVDLRDPVVIRRYELSAGRAAELEQVDHRAGEEALVASRPFPYELVPAALVAP